ncbi:MAG: PfkB family carbohydrate kinase [Candidatus Eiseniibacteriota bacterium]
MPRIVCAGLVASDFVARVPFPVPRDVKVRVSGFVRQGGGPAANAAVAIARLGGRAAFLGAVGDDALGRSQIEELAGEGVDATGVAVVAGAASFVSFILVDAADGARTIFSAPSERPVLPQATRLPAPAPDLLLLDGWAGAAARPLAREARRAGVPVLLDAGAFTEEVCALLPEVDVAIVSTPFAEAAAGAGRPDDAVRWILARGPRLAAVTAGEQGALAGAAGADETFRVPADPVRVTDTTGAGDAFHGGAGWALARGETWEQSLRVGAAVAALKCRSLGAREGLPTSAELASFLASLDSPGDAP